jgi:hypothetical protein
MEVAQITGGAIIIASIICLQLNQEQDDKAPGIIRAQSRTDEYKP